MPESYFKWTVSRDGFGVRAHVWLALGKLASFEQLKDLKTGRVPYLGLELTRHAIKSQIHLVGQSLKKAQLSVQIFKNYYPL
jgi:hypothetical protein